MIRRPPRSTPLYSSAASDVYKRQLQPQGARQPRVLLGLAVLELEERAVLELEEKEVLVLGEWVVKRVPPLFFW